MFKILWKLNDRRSGFWAGWRRLESPTTRLSIRVAVWGFIITIALGVLSYVYYLDSATRASQLKSLENQLQILSKLSIAQADRDKKFRETLFNIEKQIILDTKIEYVKIKVFFDNVKDYEQSQLYFWFSKTNLFDIEMFFDLPGTINKDNFPVYGTNVHPEDYLLFDRWVSYKSNTDTRTDYHRLSTNGFKINKFITGELYVHPDNQLRRLTIKDFNKSFLRVLVNEKARKQVQKIELILNDSIVLEVFLNDCIVKEERNFNDYPDKLDPRNIYDKKWFLIGVEVPHTAGGVAPFEVHLY